MSVPPFRAALVLLPLWSIDALGCSSEDLPRRVEGLHGRFEVLPMAEGAEVDVALDSGETTSIGAFSATAREPGGFFITGRISFKCHLLAQQAVCEPGVRGTLLIADLDGDERQDVVASGGVQVGVHWGGADMTDPSSMSVLEQGEGPGEGAKYAVRRGDELLIGSPGPACAKGAPSLFLYQRQGRTFLPEKFEQPNPLRLDTNFVWVKGFLGRDEVVATSATGCDGLNAPILYSRDQGGRFEPLYLEEPRFARNQPVPGSPMGVVVADFNSDGRSDFLYTNDPQLDLFFATEDNQLVPTEYPEDLHQPQTGSTDLRTGLPDQLLGWGVVPMDLDQDGHTDFCVANGMDEDRRAHGKGNTDAQWPSCFVQVEADGEWGRFVNVTEQLGLDAFKGQHYGLEKADVDGDGFDDLLFGAQGAQPFILRWRKD